MFEAIADKDLVRVESILENNPKLNLNCLDKDQLTPLQHACHTGNLELAKLLIKRGSDINFTGRKDGYTSLMFAALGSRESIVRLLLEHNADTTIENCVHRTAAQMAAFVGCHKVVTLINNWVSFDDSVEPYTRCRELEEKPRIESPELGVVLHNFIVHPALHPVKLLIYIQENFDLVKHASQFLYVLENLSAKTVKPPKNDESLALRYHYLGYLIDHCRKSQTKGVDAIIRQLIKRNPSNDTTYSPTPQLDRLVLECIMKFPYTQSAIFKTMTFALSKRGPDDLNALNILIQSLNGPRMFSTPAEACIVCSGTEKTKRCSRCKSVYYCGPPCQRVDWFQHKKVCAD